MPRKKLACPGMWERKNGTGTTHFLKWNNITSLGPICGPTPSDIVESWKLGLKHAILCSISKAKLLKVRFSRLPLQGKSSTSYGWMYLSIYLCICFTGPPKPVIGQTVQKLVSHWLRLGAMFRKRAKFWGVGGKCYLLYKSTQTGFVR